MYLKKENTKPSENSQHEYKHYQHIIIHSRLLTGLIDIQYIREQLFDPSSNFIWHRLKQSIITRNNEENR